MNEKILIIESHRHLRDRYARVLEVVGYEVLTSSDGLGAFEVLSQQPIELAVLERDLPDGDGLDYLRSYLRLNRNMKVIINAHHPIHPMNFKAWVADAYVVKSNDCTELLSAVAQLLPSERAKSIPSN